EICCRKHQQRNSTGHWQRTSQRHRGSLHVTSIYRRPHLRKTTKRRRIIKGDPAFFLPIPFIPIRELGTAFGACNASRIGACGPNRLQYCSPPEGLRCAAVPPVFESQCLGYCAEDRV